MNQVQLDLCQKILNKLKNRPISQLFFGTIEHPCEPKMEHPTNFRFIEEKLQRALYPDCNAFIDEIRAFLKSYTDDKQGDPLMVSAAQQMQIDFERELESVNPLKKGLSLRLGIVASEFNDFIKYTKKSQTYTKREGQPAASIFLTQPENISVKELIREIKFLRSPDLLLRVTAFIFKRQPECIVLGQEITIEFQVMKAEVLAELKKFVRSLIYKAAAGELNPLGDTYSTSIPVILEEI